MLVKHFRHATLSGTEAYPEVQQATLAGTEAYPEVRAIHSERSTHRKDHRCPLHDLDLLGRVEKIVHDVAHVAGWGTNKSAWSRDMFFLLDVYGTDPAQHLVTAC